MNCPKCGYPNTFDGAQYKGVYTPGTPCSHCFYSAHEVRVRPKLVLAATKVGVDELPQPLPAHDVGGHVRPARVGDWWVHTTHNALFLVTQEYFEKYYEVVA